MCRSCHPHGPRSNDLSFGVASRYTRTMELRLDWLRSDRRAHDVSGGARQIPEEGTDSGGDLPANSGRRETGRGAQAELYWLGQAREAGCQWCDLEIETLRELPRAVGAVVAGAAEDSAVVSTILSGRRRCRATLLHARRGEADAVKIAVRARSTFRQSGVAAAGAGFVGFGGGADGRSWAAGAAVWR